MSSDQINDRETEDQIEKVPYAPHPKEANDKASIWFYFYRAKDGKIGLCLTCDAMVPAKQQSTSGMRRYLKKWHNKNPDYFKPKTGMFPLIQFNLVQ